MYKKHSPLFHLMAPLLEPPSSPHKHCNHHETSPNRLLTSPATPFPPPPLSSPEPNLPLFLSLPCSQGPIHPSTHQSRQLSPNISSPQPLRHLDIRDRNRSDPSLQSPKKNACLNRLADFSLMVRATETHKHHIRKQARGENKSS